MKRQIIYLFVFCLFGLLQLNAQKYTTIQYFSDDTTKLELDFFAPSKQSSAIYPLVIYVHGGGFATGDRSTGYELCKYLAKNGIASATISYTLYMKNKNFSCEGSLTEKIKAIQYGVNDLWLATSFFIKNYQKYRIDTTRIFIAGNSAGAETSLHAAFWDFETMNLYKDKMNSTFKYAGIIAGAGALMDLNLINDRTMIPVFVFHGSNDILVPYATAAHHFCKTNAPGWIMLFGSYSIYNYIISLSGSVHLITFCGGGHEYSDELFQTNQQPIVEFINDVQAGEKFQQHTMIPTSNKNSNPSAIHFCK